MLFEVLKSADVLFFKFTGPNISVNRIGLTFDGLSNEFI